MLVNQRGTSAYFNFCIWNAKFKFEKSCHDLASPVKLNCQSLPAHLQLVLFTRLITSSISQTFRKRFMKSPSNKLCGLNNVTRQTLFFTVKNFDHISLLSTIILFVTHLIQSHSLTLSGTNCANKCVRIPFSFSRNWSKVASPYCICFNLYTINSQISPRIILNKLFLCRNAPIKIYPKIISLLYLLFLKYKPFCLSFFPFSNFPFQIQAHFHFSITFYIQLYSRLNSYVDAYTTQPLFLYFSRLMRTWKYLFLYFSRLMRTWNHIFLYFSRLMTTWNHLFLYFSRLMRTWNHLF